MSPPRVKDVLCLSDSAVPSILGGNTRKVLPRKTRHPMEHRACEGPEEHREEHRACEGPEEPKAFRKNSKWRLSA